MTEKYIIIEKDKFDGTEITIATRSSWERACKEVDTIRKMRTPRLNLRYGFTIKPVPDPMGVPK